MKEDEERTKRGMGKLLNTSKKLVDRNIELSSDDSDGQITDNPIGDFSSNDLIRNRIGHPSVFDEPETAQSNNLVVVSTPNVVNSRWSLSSLNPMSYFGSDNVQGGNVRKSDKPRTENMDVEQPGPSGELGHMRPQHTSTPDDVHK